jgi:8-oxo-dGTP diphosphatase
MIATCGFIGHSPCVALCAIADGRVFDKRGGAEDGAQSEVGMRRRPSSRLLILDLAGQVLLFRFAFKSGALAGEAYWATPGGAVEAGESFAQAALRELMEETGIRRDNVGPGLTRKEFPLRLENGETVWADERYFVIRSADRAVAREGWTALEKEVMAEHKWWSVEELSVTTETFWPKDLVALIAMARALPDSAGARLHPPGSMGEQ